MITDTFTNFLLVVLIGLLSFIGKIFYDKLNESMAEIRSILISDMANKKDIQQLQNRVDGHEERIDELEKK